MPWMPKKECWNGCKNQSREKLRVIKTNTKNYWFGNLGIISNIFKNIFFYRLVKEARLQGNKVNGVEMGRTESPTDHSKKWTV